MSVPTGILPILSEAFGDLPHIRPDTPLASLGFEDCHAVLLAHLARIHGLTVPGDREFVSIRTVGDLSAACECVI